MPDNFWFKVESPADVLGTDGETVVGRLEPGIAYRAIDANDHWLAIPGPNGTRGFVAIHDLVYEELAIPWNHAEPESEDADADQDERDEELVEARSRAASAEVPQAKTTAAVAAAASHRLADEPPTADPPTAEASGGGEDLDDAGPSFEPLGASEPDVEDADDGDPSAIQRRNRLIAAGAAVAAVVLIFLISALSGGDETPSTTLATASTTTATSTTTSTVVATTTTLPPTASTPAADLAPNNWGLVFYNDFEKNLAENFRLGDISGNATAEVVDGAYTIDIDGQRSMSTLLQVPLESRFAFISSLVEETRLEAGAHVCGLIFTTDAETYLFTVNAQVTDGPREYALIDSTGKELIPVTGSAVIGPDANQLAVLVKAPNFRVYINGQEVAQGTNLKGKQFTGFGLTYGASSTGRCAFDDLEVWRPARGNSGTDSADAATSDG